MYHCLKVDDVDIIDISTSWLVPSEIHGLVMVYCCECEAGGGGRSGSSCGGGGPLACRR